MVENEQQVELARLELEHSRVEIERRRLMMDERHAELEVLVAGAERSRDFSNQYAKTALQSVFLLNGGALIAFPAFGQLVGAAFNEHLSFVIASLAGFVVGLMLAVLATLLGFLALDADAQSSYYKAWDRQRQYAKVQFPDTYDGEMEAERVEFERTSDKFRKKFQSHRRLAIGLGVSSLGAFIWGAICASVVLSRNVPAVGS